MDHLNFFMGLVRLGYFSIEKDGTIWRLLRRNKYGGYTDTKTNISKQYKKGYVIVVFQFNRGKGKKPIQTTCKAHRMVYTYFKGEIPKGLTINHIDGNRSNNKPENLEIATYKYQIEHATYILGTRLFIEHRNPMSKMTEDDYKILKKLADEGKRVIEISKYFSFMTYGGIKKAVCRYRENRGKI